jgi:N-methylhydantoinase A/oxoprolinase/acetone carboxylase beta subunit
MAHTSDNVLLASDLAAWDRLIVALSSRDLPTISQLLATGDLVPVSAGTGLVVDEDLATLAQVRILSGPAAGLRGLVPSRSLQQTSLAA